MNETWSSFIERKVLMFEALFKTDKEQIYKWIEIDGSNLEDLEKKLSFEKKETLYLYFLFIDFLLTMCRQQEEIEDCFVSQKDKGKYPCEFIIRFYIRNIDPFLFHMTSLFPKILCTEKKLSRFTKSIQKTSFEMASWVSVFFRAFEKFQEEILYSLKESTVH